MVKFEIQVFVSLLIKIKLNLIYKMVGCTCTNKWQKLYMYVTSACGITIGRESLIHVDLQTKLHDF